MNMEAANSLGKPKMPVEMAGKAMDVNFQFIGQGQAAANGCGQFFFLLSDAPDRADGMDDVLTGHVPTGGVSRFGVADRAVAAHPRAAFLLDGRTARAGDGRGYPAAVRQVGVGRVDNPVHFHGSEISLTNFQGPAAG